MIIRKAVLEDINNNLLKLYIEGFNYHYEERPDIFSLKKEDELKEDLINTINYSNLLILEEDSKVIGYIVYEIKNKHYKKIWINELIIDKDYQGKGNGKVLIEKVKEIAKKENCERIELKCWSFNKNALDMYKHIGFLEQQVVLEMKI